MNSTHQKQTHSKGESMKRTLIVGLGLMLSTLLLSSFAGAQSVDPPLGDYARKVKKDPVAAKAKPKVFDNDNLPTDDKLSVVGQQSAAAAPADNAAPADDKDKDKNKDKNNDKAAGTKAADDDPAKKQAAWKEWQDKLATQKNSIDLAARELDVLQREYQLRAAAFYADAGNRIRNSAQWDKQDADYKEKIADKQKALDDAKQKLDDMKEEARRAGVPAGLLE
jgi:hypothetical protein